MVNNDLKLYNFNEDSLRPYFKSDNVVNGVFEIAKRIIEITNNCVLVAHNADFDYRILKTEFKRLGFSFNSKIICTVILSKKLIPNLKSYKLGNLSKSLGIPIHNRHRAQGDAMATLKIFELLLNKDFKKNIDSFIIESNKPKKILWK